MQIIVPLADNINQAIVPIPKTLGDGKNPRSNLYWGAMYGTKTMLSKSPNFRKIECQSIDQTILERCEFQHKSSKSKVVAEAYAGDKMFKALSTLHEGIFQKSPAVDLIVFAGHNGLMDFSLDQMWLRLKRSRTSKNQSDPNTPFAVLACQSKSYFKAFYKSYKTNPILLTKTNMAPEGYVVEALVHSFLENNSKSKIKEDVAKAYAKYQKVSVKAASRTFASGF